MRTVVLFYNNKDWLGNSVKLIIKEMCKDTKIKLLETTDMCYRSENFQILFRNIYQTNINKFALKYDKDIDTVYIFDDIKKMDIKEVNLLNIYFDVLKYDIDIIKELLYEKKDTFYKITGVESSLKVDKIEKYPCDINKDYYLSEKDALEELKRIILTNIEQSKKNIEYYENKQKIFENLKNNYGF